MLLVDGSFGEGGGQILRTSIALSLISGVPFRIEKIRAGRKKPGLLRQHLTAVLAAQRISGAALTGAEIGSGTLEFHPGSVTPGNYRFSVGTAGSTSLVLQTVLPALFRAGAPSELALEGGTHNPSAPTFDFIDRAFLPAIGKLGMHASARLIRHGFYPAGGGEIAISIQPAAPSTATTRLELLERGAIKHQHAEAIASALPFAVIRRELETLAAKLGWDPPQLLSRAVKAHGPGNVVQILIESEQVVELITAFGARGVRSEEVASHAAEEALAYLRSGVPVGQHLADQLLLPMALAGGGAFITGPVTRHTETQAEMIRRFLGKQVTLSAIGEARTQISVE